MRQGGPRQNRRSIKFDRLADRRRKLFVTSSRHRRGAAMRVLLIPTVLVGVLAVTGSDEPTESAMRAAFQTTLPAQVRSALDFVPEIGGQAALAKGGTPPPDPFPLPPLPHPHPPP